MYFTPEASDVALMPSEVHVSKYGAYTCAGIAVAAPAPPAPAIKAMAVTATAATASPITAIRARVVVCMDPPSDVISDRNPAVRPRVRARAVGVAAYPRLDCVRPTGEHARRHDGPPPRTPRAFRIAVRGRARGDAGRERAERARDRIRRGVPVRRTGKRSARV